MIYTHDEIGDFLTYFSTIGDTIVLDTHRLDEATLLGYGELFLPSRSFEFSVHLTQDKQITENICMTEPDDFGCFEIILHQHYLGQAHSGPHYKGYVEYACARQLIRMAISEMPPAYKGMDHTTLGLGQYYRHYPAMLDYQPERQAFFVGRAMDSNATVDKITFYNLITTALNQGAVNIREFEVDLETLRLVSPGELAITHYFTYYHMRNRAVIQEIKNRTARFLQKEYNPDVIHPEYEMRFDLHG